jgi:hypothetical protein
MPANLNDDSFIDTGYPSLIVIDDLMRDATNSKDVCELFVEGSRYPYGLFVASVYLIMNFFG